MASLVTVPPFQLKHKKVMHTSVCTLALNEHKQINPNTFFEPLTFEPFMILIKSNTRKKPCYLAHYENCNFKMYQQD